MDSLANVPAQLSALLVDPALVRQLKQRASDLTPPSVVKRKRRLTLPLDAPAPTTGRAKWFGRPEPQRIYDQAQSPLMRLPAELRKQIWTHVILGTSNGVVEIGWRSTGLSQGRASAYRVSFTKPRSEWGPGVLGMLRSCRVIYSESIHLVYAIPTFSFGYQNVETLFAFLAAVLPHRRGVIRTLDLRCLGQCRVSDAPTSDSSPRLLDHHMSRRWSYARISRIRALSHLPQPVGDTGFVEPEAVVEEVLSGMEGLRKGGVRWGYRSTGCFEQTGGRLGLSGGFECLSAEPGDA